MTKLTVSGKRKTAIAKAYISEGEKVVTINRRNYNNLHLLDKLKIEEPLKIAENVLGEDLKLSVHVKVKGGGEKGQIEAARLAIARALVQFTKSAALRKAYVDYDRSLLVADVRRKEAYKPGDSKARRKRQKSYR